MTVEQLASRFWGKAGRTPPHRVHPALFHMLDVGLVGRELVLRSDGAMFDRLAAELGLADGRAADAIGFLVALHDLGKISPGFQAKVPDLTHELRAVDYPFPPDAEQDHSFTTQVALAAMTGGPWSHVPARAIAAHHGSFHPTAGCDAAPDVDGEESCE